MQPEARCGEDATPASVPLTPFDFLLAASKFAELDERQHLADDRAALRRRELTVAAQELELKRREEAHARRVSSQEDELRQAARLRQFDIENRLEEVERREQRQMQREEELKRAAALDARALALEEQRLKAVEAELSAKLDEAAAAVDALERAQRETQSAAARWEDEQASLRRDLVETRRWAGLAS